MNLSKFFCCVLLATAYLASVAQGAADENLKYQEKGTYWTPLLEALKKADFNEHTTYTYAKPNFLDLAEYKKFDGTFQNSFDAIFPADFVESLAPTVSAFFIQLVTDKLQPLNRALVGTSLRPDLTWQQVENIIKILNHTETLSAIISKIGQNIVFQNNDISSLKTAKKYRIKLFLKSLKTIFETRLATAKNNSSYQAKSYVPETLFEDLLKDADHNTQLIAQAKAAMTAATTKRVEQKKELQTAEKDQKQKIDAVTAKKESAEIKETKQHITNLEQQVVAAEAAVEQAKTELAAAEASAKIPPALPVNPLEQLQHALTALKTKLAQLGQALNHLQNQAAPHELPSAENKAATKAKAKLAQAEANLQAARQALLAAQQAAELNQNFIELQELEQKEKDAQAAALASLKQYTTANTDFRAALAHYKAILQSVEISIQTAQEKHIETTESVTSEAQDYFDTIEDFYSRAKIKNKNWEETKEIETRFSAAMEKLAELKKDSNDIEQKKALKEVIKYLLEEVRTIEQKAQHLALRIDEARKNNTIELETLLKQSFPEYVPMKITIARANAMSKLNSPKEQDRIQGCKIIEDMIQKYKK
ncbi:hypothetical protein IPF37_04665 [bacterium]|nr:MAG: hypothetical protein IPF37_04665 [bacterium]